MTTKQFFEVSTDDAKAVKGWLEEHGPRVRKNDEENLAEYVRNQLGSNSDWDGVPIVVMPVDKPEVDRDSFMEFFRRDDFQQHMSCSDCEEIFLNSLKGSSDLTLELLEDLKDNYGI